jgi:hypothetical protein
MSEQSVVLDGVVGSDAQGLSLHRHHARVGQDSSLASIGLWDYASLIWQRIEMPCHLVARSSDISVSGNIVRVLRALAGSRRAMSSAKTGKP